jgi:membrane protease YdiL (CAAX protease family)
MWGLRRTSGLKAAQTPGGIGSNPESRERRSRLPPRPKANVGLSAGRRTALDIAFRLPLAGHTALPVAGAKAITTVNEAGNATEPAPRAAALGAYVAPILTGLLILALGLTPWTLLAQVNARVWPDLPWASLATVTYLSILVAWLNGWGPPRGNAEQRRQRLRLWPRGAPDPDVPTARVVMALLGLVYLLWTAISRMSPIPDLSAYPTTSYRWSMFITGGLTAGVVEEVAFRGYMQTGIERQDRPNAIWITSLVFVASHITQGVGAVLALGPGLFIASMLYGTLARRIGAIGPGIVIHVMGDLARVYFGVLRGDASLLFAK